MSYSTANYANATICAPQVITYPFYNTPQADTNAKVYLREYVQQLANFSPTAMSNTATLPADGAWGANNAAYLVEETSPVPFSGTICKFQRKWATVPADQVSYSTIVINKPSIETYGTSGVFITAPFNEYYLYSSALFFAANIHTFVSASWASAPTGILANGHGVAANTNVVLRTFTGSNFLYELVPAANVTIVNANYITVAGVTNSGSGGYTLTGVGKFFRTYTPGTDRVRVKRTQSFYLPGVTPNISSPTDIPIPDPATNDETLLNLVINYSSGYQVYDAEALQSWMGQIYTQTKIEIDMANL